MKIFVKCKDKTSSRWLPQQRLSVVGSIPKQVLKDAMVNECLSKGALVEISMDEYKRHLEAQNKKHKGKGNNAELLKGCLDLLEVALDKFNYEEAGKQLSEAKKHGLKGADIKKIEGRITVAKEKAIEAAQLEIRKSKATGMIETALEKELIKADAGGVLCLGKTQIGQNAERAIDWVIQKQENFDTLEKLIGASVKE